MEKPTQKQMYYRASRRIAVINETFLELVKEGMTKQDLIKNIARRPMLWGQFSGWLEKLPDSMEVWSEMESIYDGFIESGAHFETTLEAYKSKLYEDYLRDFRPLGEQP